MESNLCNVLCWLGFPSYIVPEYSFLDARGLGAYEGKKLKSISEVRFSIFTFKHRNKNSGWSMKVAGVCIRLDINEDKTSSYKWRYAQWECIWCIRACDAAHVHSRDSILWRHNRDCFAWFRQLIGVTSWYSRPRPSKALGVVFWTRRSKIVRCKQHSCVQATCFCCI